VEIQASNLDPLSLSHNSLSYSKGPCIARLEFREATEPLETSSPGSVNCRISV